MSDQQLYIRLTCLTDHLEQTPLFMRIIRLQQIYVHEVLKLFYIMSRNKQMNFSHSAYKK